MMGFVRGVLVGLACSLLSAASPAASLEEVQACLLANIPERSSALTVRLTSRRPGSPESRHESQISWQRSPEGLSETLLCMSRPPAIRGLAYLILERDDRVMVWGYLPEAQRVVQVHAEKAASRARIARTAIGYQDLRYLPLNLSAVEPEQQPVDSRVGDRKVFVVRLALPPGSDAPYTRIVSSIDQESCVPLRTEFYDAADKLSKLVTAEVGTIVEEGGIRLARSSTISDLEREVETDLQIDKVAIDTKFPDRMFTPQYLRRGRCP